MRFAILWSLMVVCAGQVGAQSVSVRTGEHRDFTRLVLNISPGANWQLGRSLTGYVLQVEGASDYQLDGFFDLIPRTRIESAEQENDRLLLGVNCACNARAYLFRENVLVVDVRDGPPSRISTFELSLVPIALPDPTKFSINANPLLPVIFGAGTGPELEKEVDDGPVLSSGATEQKQPLPAPDEEYLADFSQQVAEALGVALTGGLVAPEQSQFDGSIANIEPQLYRTLGDLAELPGVDARTSVDQITGLVAAQPRTTQAGATCLPDAYFDIASWADDRPFHLQISEARQRLYGEFDRPDAAAVIAMTKLYLHFGFGQEAMQTLRLDGAQSQERAYLTAIAKIVDGEGGQIDGFVGQISCATKVGMWAALTKVNQPLDGQMHRDVVLREFKTLPAHLRPILGPSLAAVFIRIGDIDGAEQVLGRAAGNGTRANEIAIANSALAQATDDPATAFAELKSLIEVRSEISPEIMQEYFEVGMRIDMPFDEADFLLSDAVRFQNGQTAAVRDLTITQFRASIAQGDFDAAQNHLNDLRDTMPEEMQHELSNEFMQKAVATMSDANFGRLIWADSIRAQAPMVRRDVAARLIDMGFPQKAAAFMGQTQTSEYAIAAENGIGPDDLQSENGAIVIGQMAEPFIELDAADPSLRDANVLLSASVAMRKEIEGNLQSLLTSE